MRRPAPFAGPGRSASDPAQSVADRVHGRLVREELQDPVAVAESVTRLAREEAPLLGTSELEGLVADVVARATGLGPLEPLLADPEVTEVMVAGPGRIWVERRAPSTGRTSPSTGRPSITSSSGWWARWGCGSTGRRPWSTPGFPMGLG